MFLMFLKCIWAFGLGVRERQLHGDDTVVRDTKVIHGEVADGSRVSDDKVQCVSFGVSGDVNMLMEVEAVQQ